jgi:parvulin-like peptidyl-prolyl isomerase
LYLSKWLSEEMPISDDELHQYYEQVKVGRFVKSAKLHIRLIDIRPSKLEPSLIKASEGESTQGAALRIAKELHRRIQEGEDFGQLAEENSHGHRQSYGGQWSAFTPGALASEYAILDERARQMQPGQVSDPIQQGDHVFILKLEQTQQESVTSFDKVKDSLRKELQTSTRKSIEEAIEEADL